MDRHNLRVSVERKMREILDTMREGQKEYANSDDAFGNFNRLSSSLKMDRKAILWVYLSKHLDGILSYLHGHKSQRETVGGRIEDSIAYLLLLWCMIDEEEKVDSSIDDDETMSMREILEKANSPIDDDESPIVDDDDYEPYPDYE